VSRVVRSTSRQPYSGTATSRRWLLVNHLHLEGRFGEDALEHPLGKLSRPRQRLKDDFRGGVPLPLDSMHAVLNSEKPDDFLALRGGAGGKDLAYLVGGIGRQTISGCILLLG
jgi:hypothetical protein